MRQMHLTTMLDSAGHHVAGWRLPEARAGSDDFDTILEITQTAERAKFDMVFLADSLFMSTEVRPGSLFKLEPLTLLSALAARTSRIGLGATVSTTYGEPYHVARMFGSLDHISKGRAAWNVVTTAEAKTARNFGRNGHPTHAERYEVAAEFVQVVKGLWDSWEDDAEIHDKSTGQFADLGKLHSLDHKGKYFSVDGPLNLRRPPQGHPVIIQAGASADGRALAASVGEVIFASQHEIPSAKAFYDQMKADAAARGRDPSEVKIILGICPFVGNSEQDAKAKLTELGSMMDPVSGLKVLSDRVGHDLSAFPLDGPLPELPQSQMMQGHAVVLTALARKHNLTIRELRDYAASALGHRILLGSPQQIADDLEEWFAAGAADGFMVVAPWSPGAFDDFATKVVPVLQERGIFRSEYAGSTLRDNLGLRRPAHPASGARLSDRNAPLDMAGAGPA